MRSGGGGFLFIPSALAIPEAKVSPSSMLSLVMKYTERSERDVESSPFTNTERSLPGRA